VETTNTNVPGITSPSMLDKVSQNSVGLHCYCGLRSFFFFDKVVCDLLVLERQKLSHALNNIRCKVNFYG